MTVFLLLTCVQLLQYLRTKRFLYKARICSRVTVVLVSTYCQSGISGDISERKRVYSANGASAPNDKTATIQYKPATSLAGNSNTLAHYEQSRGYDQIWHAYSWCTGWAVISVTSYPYTLWTRVSCQAVSPMNGLGMRLGAAWLAINNIIFFGGSYTIEPNGCSRGM